MGGVDGVRSRNAKCIINNIALLEQVIIGELWNLSIAIDPKSKSLESPDSAFFRFAILS